VSVALATASSLGAAVGLTLALTGAGGGIVAVPLLVFALNLKVAEAAPIGLLAVGLAAALGAALGLCEGKVRYRAAVLIGGAGMLMAPLGVALSQHLPNGPLTAAFAGVLAWSALGMYSRSGRHPSEPSVDPLAERPPCVRNPGTGRLIWTRPCALVLAGTGMGSGLLSGLLGVGGGFVIVPALSRFSNLAADGIVSTSLAVIALVSLSGVASAVAHDAIDWSTALPFACGAAAALMTGRRLAMRWSGPTLQRCFAMLSMVIALLLLWRGLDSISGWTSPL
jgi:uncharacterized membrane protein YfcA